MSNKYRQRDSHFGSYQCICVCAGEDTDFNAMPYLKVYRLFSWCCTTTKRGLSILFSVTYRKIPKVSPSMYKPLEIYAPPNS